MARTRRQASAQRRAKNRARGKSLTHARVRARPHHLGSRYKVTKRCHERRFFLAPGSEPEKLINLIGYCLAYTANKYDIEIHAAVTMSNHYHIDVTDLHGQLPAWKQLFNSLIARGLNALHGRDDTFWSNKKCDTLHPRGDESLADLVYTITNPVKSGLVKWSHQWPGFSTAGWHFGETRTYQRPTWFFDVDGDMPETASLTLSRPPICPELDGEALFNELQAAIRRTERKLQAKLRAMGRRFMGLRKLAKQGWNQVARNFEERFQQTPKVATGSRWLRLAQLQRDREWEREYAVARERWLAGDAAVVFPAGTYWLRRFAGVAVAEHPP